MHRCRRDCRALSWLKRQVSNLDEARRSLETVITESHHADDVIKGVRAMFKHESTVRSEVNLNELIQQVVAVTARPIASNNIVLEAHLADDVPPLVMADPVQLQQVILNLVMISRGMRRRLKNTSRILAPRFPTPRWSSPASRTRRKPGTCGPISTSLIRTAIRNRPG